MKRIQSKITLTYALLAFLVIAAVGILFSTEMESYFTDKLVANLGNRADVLWYLLSSEPAVSPDELDLRVKEISRLADLRITLITADGTVLVDSDVPFNTLSSVENHLQRPEIQQALQGKLGVETRHSATVGKNFLYVAKSVTMPAAAGPLQSVKFVRLSTHLEEIRKTTADIRSTMLVAGLAVLVMILIVSMFLSRRISKPMVEIAQKVREIRAGNLDTQIEVRENDEVGEVARAVNEMVGKLKSDIVQLKKLERVRSEFLGNVSHELRTPIFSLQGFLETLIEGAVDDPAVNRDFLKKAQAHAARLNTLLADLITISQIESGEMKMSFRYFDLNEFLDSLLRELRPTAELHGVSLRRDGYPAGSLEVFGDRERLQVVMENLIENAIKYNRPSGEVVLASDRSDRKVRVSVSDSGLGIAAAHIPRIFERFYRVDRDRSRDVGGTGLGLAIVKHIIEAHGSSVKVESEPGKGSTFSFELKL